jgi:hypothetical protein
MPAKSAGNKSKEKEAHQTEDSVREKKRQQKLVSHENGAQENSGEGDESSREHESIAKNDQNSVALYGLLYADFVFDPTTPSAIEDAMQAVENEQTEMRKVADDLANTWEHFKSLNIFAHYTTLQAKDPSLTPALTILELWSSMRRRQGSGAEKALKQNQKRGTKHAVDEIDPHDRELAAKLSVWMDESVRMRFDTSAEYDRCRPLYESICQLLRFFSIRCVKVRKHLEELSSSASKADQTSRLRVNSFAWSDFACPVGAETELPPSAAALRFANPVKLIRESKENGVVNLRSPSIELSGHTWIATLCAGEAAGFLGLFIELLEGVLTDTLHIGDDRFFVRASVRRGAVDQVTRYQIRDESSVRLLPLRTVAVDTLRAIR